MSAYKLALATVLASGLGVASTVSAAVVYDGGLPNQRPGLYADSGYSWTTAAQKISLASSLTFDSMTWWGNPSGSSTFVLTVLEGSGSVPGNVLQSLTLNGVGATPTGGTIVYEYSQWAEIAYQADFGGILLPSGDYFIALSSVNDLPDEWFWERTDNGPLPHSASYNGTWYDAPLAFAFQLSNNSNVPEPASLSLLGLGLAGLAVVRRRK